MKAEAEITQAFSQYAYAIASEHVQSKREELHEELKKIHASEEKSEKEKEAAIGKINRKLKILELEEHGWNLAIGGVTGEIESAGVKAGLSFSASWMREWAIKDSKKFKGVVDINNTDYMINNISGESVGVRGDGYTIGGTRIDLDIICGRKNQRCVTDPDDPKTLLLDHNGMVQFKGKMRDDKGNEIPMSLDYFLYETKEGKKSIGTTGGIQGGKGIFFGREYEPGSFTDKAVEAFAGTHDTIGGKLSGLYDRDGNARRDRPEFVRTIHNIWSIIAIAPSTPFALSEFLSSNAWNSTSILLKSVK